MTIKTYGSAEFSACCTRTYIPLSIIYFNIPFIQPQMNSFARGRDSTARRNHYLMAVWIILSYPEYTPWRSSQSVCKIKKSAVLAALPFAGVLTAGRH
jgi:hypothetical protein